MHYEIVENVLPQDTLFIHGNLASLRWWYPALDVWKQKAPSRLTRGRAILADWRGCGLTPVPETAEEMSPERLAGDFVELLDRLAIPPVHVVGHSTGGLIALLAMVQAPEKFKRAFLLDPVGAQGVQFDETIEQAFAQMHDNKELTGMVIGGTIHGLKMEDPFFREIILEDAFAATRRIGMKLLSTLKGRNDILAISQLQHPVLVVHGEFDQVLPIVESRQLSHMLPHGSFYEIPGHGHCLNVEDPALFVSLVEPHLFALEAPRAPAVSASI